MSYAPPSSRTVRGHRFLPLGIVGMHCADACHSVTIVCIVTRSRGACRYRHSRPTELDYVTDSLIFVFQVVQRRPLDPKHELGQHTWQFGPDVGTVLQLRRTIAYAFVQQWFKVAGDGGTTNQMSGVLGRKSYRANFLSVPEAAVPDWATTFGRGVAWSSSQKL